MAQSRSPSKIAAMVSRVRAFNAENSFDAAKAASSAAKRLLLASSSRDCSYARLSAIASAMFSEDSFRFFSDSSEDARLSAMAFFSSAGLVVCRRLWTRDAAMADASARGSVVCSRGSTASPPLESVSSKESFRRHSRIRPPPRCSDLA